MARFFLECRYVGTDFRGFQIQENAATVQGEIQKALHTILRREIELTGSSRTDAGVHALQNYFHFDEELQDPGKLQYNLNAVLPPTISVSSIREVKADVHSRFHALSRSYEYFISARKDPFRYRRSYHFPYTLNYELMQEAAAVLQEYEDFTSFSKRNTQVKTFECRILESEWKEKEGEWCYRVTANRFLRGMVRALTATMLRVGRGQMSIGELRAVIEAKDCTRASFAAPAEGLYLVKVAFPVDIWV